ncbi:unnamed protein product, partial [Hymenolepis diminuta]
VRKKLTQNGFLATFHTDIKQSQKYLNLQIDRNISSTGRYRFKYNHNFKKAVKITGSSKTRTGLPISNQCLRRICYTDWKIKL